MKKTGRVLFCSDDRGFRQLKVALYSLLKTAETDRPLEVFVFTAAEPLTAEHRTELLALVPAAGPATLKIIDVDALLERHRTAFENPRSPWGIMIWARCFVGEILSDVTGSVVYLDIDTLVCRDLRELYDLDMGTNAVAGVYEDAREDGNNPRFWDGPLPPKTLTRYFNSGVLVLNVGVFRNEHALETIAAWYAAHKDLAERPDQDALNCVFAGRIVRLHPAYNYSDGWLERQARYALSAEQWRGNPPREMLEAILDPAVLHFWGRAKPWRWNHRPEGRRYAAVMRELGLLAGPLEDTTTGRRLIGFGYGLYHGLLRSWARWRLRHAV